MVGPVSAFGGSRAWRRSWHGAMAARPQSPAGARGKPPTTSTQGRANLNSQVRNIADSHCRGSSDLGKKITVARGESRAEDPQHRCRPAQLVCPDVTAGQGIGTKASWSQPTARRAGTWKDLTDNVNERRRTSRQLRDVSKVATRSPREPDQQLPVQAQAKLSRAKRRQPMTDQ